VRSGFRCVTVVREMVWQKGQSPNPGGRTRQAAGMSARLSREIEAETEGGAELWRAVLAVMRKADPSSPPWARIKLEAAAMLLDRLAGKPQALVEVTKIDETAQDLDAVLARLTPDQLANLDAALAALGAQEETTADAPAPALQ
jgi:hypothetical protein